MFANNLIGVSKAFQSVTEDIAVVAPLDCSVLIQGETGTGKEVVARAIHDSGARRNKAFVAVNCAAIPHALIESEFFGHEKGAFTGAVNSTVGRFLAAHEGTLFLDEIGDLPIELQPKLLRVLQEQEFERVGSTRSTRVDVRIIAATNVHLPQMVTEKRFRADLYYRLNVFPIVLPPLRDRKDDIPALVHYFVEQCNRRMGKRIVTVPDNVLNIMSGYHWPGNIRELQNFVERAAITSFGNMLMPRTSEMESLSLRTQDQTPLTLAAAERAHIEGALTATNWVVSGRDGAAARLGLPRTTLISRMQRLNITKPQPTSRESAGIAKSEEVPMCRDKSIPTERLPLLPYQ